MYQWSVFPYFPKVTFTSDGVHSILDGASEGDGQTEIFCMKACIYKKNHQR